MKQQFPFFLQQALPVAQILGQYCWEFLRRPYYEADLKNWQKGEVVFCPMPPMTVRVSETEAPAAPEPDGVTNSAPKRVYFFFPMTCSVAVYMEPWRSAYGEHWNITQCKIRYRDVGDSSDAKKKEVILKGEELIAALRAVMGPEFSL